MILNDVCELIVDCLHSTAYDEGCGYPLIRTPNIGRGRLILDDVHRVSEKVYIERNVRATPQEDDLVLAREAPAGNIAIIGKNQKVCLGQRTVLIRPDIKKVSSLYLMYYLLMPNQQYELLGTANGATVPHVNMSTIRKLPIALPDLDTQKSVAEFINVYDNLIENNQKQIKLLEEASQRLYKEWFIDLRFPGHENVEIVDGTPVGWECLDFLKVAPIITGKKDANFGSENGKYLFFTCSQQPLLAESYSYDCDAVILAGNGDFNVKLYRGKFEAYQRTYVLSPYKTEHLYLLFYTIKNRMNYLIQGASGSTIKFLTKGMIADIKVLVPTCEILNQYNEIAEPLQRKLEVLIYQNKLLTEARDRLLPKLMSGEIEV